MSDEWKFVLDEAPFEFLLGRRSSERRLLLASLERLKSDPHQMPDHYMADDLQWAVNCQ